MWTAEVEGGKGKVRTCPHLQGDEGFEAEVVLTCTLLMAEGLVTEAEVVAGVVGNLAAVVENLAGVVGSLAEALLTLAGVAEAEVQPGVA